MVYFFGKKFMGFGELSPIRGVTSWTSSKWVWKKATSFSSNSWL